MSFTRCCRIPSFQLYLSVVLLLSQTHDITTTRPFGNYLFPPSSEATLTAELICFVVSVTSPGKANSWFPIGHVVVLSCVCDNGKSPDIIDKTYVKQLSKIYMYS